MKFDPGNYHRHSIRLPGYDYSQPGAYFITLVTFQRECLFGEIQNGEMKCSPLGQIAQANWRAIPEHFPNVELGAYIVMPNHVHGILIIQPDIVGATHCVAPTKYATPTDCVAPTPTEYLSPDHVASATTTTAERPNGPNRGSIGAIIGAYKMSVTRSIQKELQSPNMSHPMIWQRNYYEHILRSDQEHNRIHLYIEANPGNWSTDDERPLKPI